MNTCQHCMKNYKDEESLKRHQRYAHREKKVRCRFQDYDYELPSNSKYKMKDHEKRRHEDLLDQEQKMAPVQVVSLAPTPLVQFFQMTPIASPEPIYFDAPIVVDLTEEEQKLFTRAAKRVGSLVPLLSLSEPKQMKLKESMQIYKAEPWPADKPLPTRSSQTFASLPVPKTPLTCTITVPQLNQSRQAQPNVSVSTVSSVIKTATTLSTPTLVQTQASSMMTSDNLSCVPEGEYDPEHPWMGGDYRRV